MATIGTEYHEDLFARALIATYRRHLSRPVDITKYAAIYGGAQNLAPAGVAFAIIREDMLDRVVRDLPTMVAFRAHVERLDVQHASRIPDLRAHGDPLRWLKSIGGVPKSTDATGRPPAATTRSTATRCSAVRSTSRIAR